MNLDFFRFGNEKESFRKLISFLKNPSLFYAKNKDDDNSLVDFTTFMLRMGVLVRFIFDIVLQRETAKFALFALVAGIVIAPIGASFGLWIWSRFLNFFVKKVAKVDNVVAAQRTSAFASVAGIFFSIPYISLIALIGGIILIIIGLSKQYKISFTKSFFSIFIPIVIVLILFTLPVLSKLQELSYSTSFDNSRSSFCEDSDIIGDLYTKGFANFDGYIVEDVCESEIQISQVFCNGDSEKGYIPFIRTENCPNGCSEGVCI
jgi:hypothetical protein